MRFSAIYIWVLFIVFSFSCSSTRQVSRLKDNYADIYNPGKNFLHPDFSAYHVNDSVSVLYIRIAPAELLFNQANETGDFLAQLQYAYQLNILDDNGNRDELIDSSTMKIILNRKSVRNSYFSAIPIKADFGNKYILNLKFKDLLRNVGSEHFILIDKTSKFNGQNFNVFMGKSEILNFRRIFNSTNSFRIKYNRIGYDSLYIDYFSLDRTLPRPVFSTAPEIPLKSFPDSSWVFPYSDTMLLSMPLKGIYQFRVDLNSTAALSLYNFNESFPQIKTTDDLLGPLVYLSSSSEFRDLRMEPNRKLAVDNFWLDIAGNMDNARELIRVYYNRVYFANRYFTSYKEGWKTDRGMIFIIFGPPDYLSKDANEEKWVYFTRKNSTPVEFTFIRKENHFTIQDYELNRDVNSTGIWAEAIRTWRRGKIYSPDTQL